MSEKIKNTTEMEEVIIRENPFCIVSKETFGELNVHSIRTSTAWSENPDPDNFAIVPDEMVPSILDTNGFCDIILNDDGTEVVSFTAREILEIPDSEHEQEEHETNEVSWDAMAEAITEGVNDV